MELTITQNGALYGLQHRGSDISRGSRRKRENASKIIRTDDVLPSSPFVWYKLKLHV